MATGRPTLTVVLLVGIFLKLQADRAADRFMKYGEKGHPTLSPWEEDYLRREEEEFQARERKGRPSRFDEETAETVRVEPLGSRGRQEHYGPRPGAAPSNHAYPHRA